MKHKGKRQQRKKCFDEAHPTASEQEYSKQSKQEYSRCGGNFKLTVPADGR